MCSNAELGTRLETVEDCVKQNNRALRGKNGEGGMVQKLGVMHTEMTAIKTILNNDITHLKTLLELRLETQEEKAVNWIEIAKGWIVPILLSLITAILVTKFV